MRRFFGYPLRGVLGFGLGLCIAAFASEYAPTSALINLLGPFLGGAVAATIFMSGGDFEPRAVPGFGCSFTLMWLVVLFAHVSIQGGGRPDLGWGAAGSALGFAIGGGLGALSMRPGLLFAGAISFAVGGAFGGFMSFYFIDNGFIYGSLPVAFGGGGVLAGGLFGICVDLLGD